ncbi:hypothetical protein TNCV_3802151 [Trichonephila clavipes]|nr:hypothetical protein TNCV_3802151 [Trichonephila clavipes]
MHPASKGCIWIAETDGSPVQMYGQYKEDLEAYAKAEARRLKTLQKLRKKEETIRKKELKTYRSASQRRLAVKMSSYNRFDDFLRWRAVGRLKVGQSQAKMVTSDTESGLPAVESKQVVLSPGRWATAPQLVRDLVAVSGRRISRKTAYTQTSCRDWSFRPESIIDCIQQERRVIVELSWTPQEWTPGRKTSLCSQ